MPINDVNDAVHETLVRVARRTLVVVAIVALALLVWRIRVALLLGFIGVLFAVLFRGEATLVKRYTRIPVGWCCCSSPPFPSAWSWCSSGLPGLLSTSSSANS